MSNDAFGGSTVEIAAVGYVHVVFLTKDGRVFTCDTGFDGYAGGLGKPYAPNEDGRLGRAFILTDGETKSVDVDEATKRWALTPGEVAVFDAAADPLDASSGSDSNEKQKTSVVAVDAGRWYRFRLLYGSAGGAAGERASGGMMGRRLQMMGHADWDGDDLAPRLAACDVLLLAKDGVYLPRAPRPIEAGYMSAGNRADWLVPELGRRRPSSRARGRSGGD